MGLEQLYAIKEDMEKAEARKLQPYFIRAFFSEAFKILAGELRSREAGRYEITHVPANIRERDRVIGETRTQVLKKYERICFEKQQIRVHGKPMASLIYPGHPLMHAVTDMMLEAHRGKLKQGAILVDPNDEGVEPHVLFMIDHNVRQSEIRLGEQTHHVSRRLQFVTIDQHGQASHAGWAPHLDLQAIAADDLQLIQDIIRQDWLNDSLDKLAINHATQYLAPEHYQEVKNRRERQAEKILAAVNERLIKEINYWSDRYIKLTDDVAAGKQPRLQSDNAKRRVEELTSRLEQRKKELTAMANVVSSIPVVIGGALVIPQGLLAQRKGETPFCVDAAARARIEQIAMQAVITTEQALGNRIKDVSHEKCGWDITSEPPIHNGKLAQARHIEVKGQSTITVSRNEIIYGLNQTEQFILAIVVVDGECYDGPYYLRNPFSQEPEFGVASINYDLNELLAKATDRADS